MIRRSFRFIRAYSAAAIVFIASFGSAGLAAQDSFGFGAAVPDAAPAAASDAASGFGFGDATDIGAAPSSPAVGAKVGGKISFGVLGFIDQSTETDVDRVGAFPDARLQFSAAGSQAEAEISLRLNEAVLKTDPAGIINQASVRVFAGPLDLEAGLLKLSWGKADAFSVLDILNPQDLTDLSITDGMDRKVAQGMVKASLALGPLAQAELVFLPSFQAHKIAWTGPWVPKQIAAMKDQARAMLYYGSSAAANSGRGNGIYSSYFATAWATAWAAAYDAAYNTVYSTAYNAAYTAGYTQLATAVAPGTPSAAQVAGVIAAAQSAAATAAAAQVKTIADGACAGQSAAIAATANADIERRIGELLAFPDTSGLEYAQAGLRLTGSLASVDLGAQYFYGYLPTPVVNADPAAFVAALYKAPVSYNRYHHIGLDAAAVIAGFNIRAEAAANLTDDWSGDDPQVYNPSLGWAFGFDRELFAGITLNAQGSGKYRLFNESVGAKAFDVEKGSDLTHSDIIIDLSQKLFRETVEWEVAGIWGVEDQDFMVSPRLAWIVGDGSAEIAGRWFGGEADGELGQFAKRNYLKLNFTYKF